MKIAKLILIALFALQCEKTPTTIPVNGSVSAVFETEPFNSKLDIFYETSTAGLVSDLNTSTKETFSLK